MNEYIMGYEDAIRNFKKAAAASQLSLLKGVPQLGILGRIGYRASQFVHGRKVTPPAFLSEPKSVARYRSLGKRVAGVGTGVGLLGAGYAGARMLGGDRRREQIVPA